MPGTDPVKVPCRTTLGREAETLVRVEDDLAVMATPFPGSAYTAEQLTLLIDALVTARRQIMATQS